MDFDDVEIVSGTVRVKIEFTVEQYKWLKTLESDLRSDFSAAVQTCVDNDMEAHTKDKYNPSRYRVIQEFENCLQRWDWREMADVLKKLQLMFKQKEIRQQLKDEK